MGNRLNRDDLDTLQRADDLKRRFDAGIFPKGAGQYRHFARLERLGYIEYTGMGRDIDREVDKDVPCYELTPKALELLADPVARHIIETGF